MTPDTRDLTTNANVALLFADAARRRSEADAIVAPDGQVLWRFGDLAEAAARMAGGLVELGVGVGDPVLVLEHNRRDLYRTVSAVIWAGGSVILPPASMPIRRALAAASERRPRAVLTSLPLWPVTAMYPGLRQAPIRVVGGPLSIPGAVRSGVIARHQPISPRAVGSATAALTTFTTGTTGPAKAVERSHGVLGAQHDALAAMRSLTAEDRDLAGLPMLVLHNLASAVTSILAPRGPASSRYGRRIREALVAGKATAFAGFPHQLQAAVQGARPGDLAGTRTVHVGGDRVRAELLEAVARVASATTCTIVYGSTEIEPIAAIDAGSYLQLLAASDPDEGTCVGRIVDGLELRLQPLSDGPASSRHRSAVGRILLCGPRASGSGGTGDWVDTGDVGRVDADGRLWLLGRAANTVEGMFPASVERVIEALPWVDQAVLVRGAEEHAATLLAVQPTRWDGATTQAAWVAQLAAITRERGWPVDDVVLVRRLPRSAGPAAKVDDRRFRALASSRRRRLPSEHP